MDLLRFDLRDQVLEGGTIILLADPTVIKHDGIGSEKHVAFGPVPIEVLRVPLILQVPQPLLEHRWQGANIVGAVASLAKARSAYIGV